MLDLTPSAANLSLHERQEDLELRSRDRGIARFDTALQKATRRDEGESTEAGLYLLKQAVAPVSAGIEAWREKALGGGAGRRSTAAKLVGDTPADLLAYLTMSTILGTIAVGKTKPLARVAAEVAKLLEEELRLASFEQQKPGLYLTIMNRLRERGATQEHTRTVATFALNRYGVDWEGWSVPERIQLGTALVEIAIASTALVDTAHVPVGTDKFQIVLRPTEELTTWLTSRNEALRVLRPVVLPMVVVPRQWKGLRGGGYRTAHVLRTPLVKRMSKGHREALEAADLACVFAGLNAVQGTAWRVNRRVLEVAETLWKNGDATGSLPGYVDRVEEIPSSEAVDMADEVAKRAWKDEARDVRNRNIGTKSKRLAATHTLGIARETVEDAELYFPHFLDFRGRCYARPMGLSPQGTDLSKGLLTFARGKPIEDGRAAGWLAIQVANSFGFDKASFEDRIAWVHDHEADIVAVAAGPIDNKWWHEADGPFTFLAACCDYAALLEHGYGYVSSLPIAMDGSCNGLQHYSALLRDPVGGAAVNLVPGDTPSDVYGEVAKVATRKLQALAAAGGEHSVAAEQWLAFKLDRKMTKRQVMVLPYGGTRNSCTEYTREAVNARIASGTPAPFGREELQRQVVWLAGIVWESMGEVVVAAREAMTWLQKIARVATTAGVPLKWTTPSGFVAFQDYKETKQRRIKTRLAGEIVRFAVKEETVNLDKHRQATGLPPNFVHSLDASAMMLTIGRALDDGVTQFAMIHDSYGTVAADTDTLAVCLREAFVEMYSVDVLSRFRDEIAEQLPLEERASLPMIPNCGSLDLAQVLHSPFFFG